ncbi:endospore germination permease [Bacillus sp. AFS053548]|uniref:GerAB/ArcD/ProY family transporter n=1 Tax=Bacillus sp. AFS053548 TaxID=2033505 RepID=UPI00159BD8A1|nr:endospore germination permease [Bacillus sp. AFS053548]
MNRKLSIGAYQFFSIIFLFEMGSATLVGIASGAMQDAWISVLTALVTGCLLLCVYIKLFDLYPELPFTIYIQSILGKFAGKLLAMVYILYFIYIGARVLRDFEELLVITLYNASSLISIGILFMFLCMYAVFKGFEVFGRVCEFLFIVILFIMISIIGFEVIAGIIKTDNLRPVLETGWKTIIKEAYPLTVTFPFGEMIVFTMILPYLRKPDYAWKVGIPGLIFAGLVLTLLTMLNICVLGANTLVRATYPILTAISYINIADFIQRLDSVVVIVIAVGGFIKITVFFFCAIIGAADLFKVKKSDTLTYPIAVIIVICSVWMAPDYLEHYKEGLDIVPYYLHIPLQIVIPTVLLVIAVIQKKAKTKTKENAA